MASEAGLVRIVFQLDPEAWHGSATERLWAEPIGEARYRLRNVPFFAFGVSNEDVVFGQSRDGEIHFNGASIRGGHSTYRLRLGAQKRQGPLFEQSWMPLKLLGCSYEEGPLVLAVDVPASANIHSVYARLQAGELAGAWDFEEAHCGHSP